MRYHLIGIKGVGMTAIAQILKSDGHIISGSDTDEEFFTDKILNNLKIPFTSKFTKDNINPDIDLIIKSSAYGLENIEVKEATNKKISIIEYPEALGKISKNHFAIAVAGTHGKTTQAALLSILCTEAGLDPLCVIGSSVPQFGNKNARTQDTKNKLMIAETCEYKNHFLHFSPNIILIPSLDYDHVDFFQTKKQYEDSFIKFVKKLPPKGHLVICADSVPRRYIREVKKISEISVVTYGFSEDSDIKVNKPQVKDGVQYSKIKDLDFQLSVPGKHNILNAAGAMIVLDLLSNRKGIKIDFDTVRSVLMNFRNTKRRLEKIGSYNGAIFIDDYAHHPVEIIATIESLKSFYPDKKIRIIFQSHTFSRSKKMKKEFRDSFLDCDEIIVAPIYPSAREVVTKYTSKDFAKTISKKNKKSIFFETYNEITEYIRKTATENDIIVAMGAGDIWRTLTALI